MSHAEAIDPVCTEQRGEVDLLITGKAKDLGGFSVRRVLPAFQRRSVGPFVFFDEMGPAEFPPGEGINVRPHPHIGLATVTYLFDGEILHRDSLGYMQAIQPGAVNLMTAGSGIVHSERTSEERLAAGQRLHGIQVWMALPDDQQEIPPAFVHHPRESLPVSTADGVTTTVIIGSHAGAASPVSVLPETLYLEQRLAGGAISRLPADGLERGVFVVKGQVSIGGCEVGAGAMAAINPEREATIHAQGDAHIMIAGGEPITPRHLWWNFVHTDSDRIEAAKALWSSGGFERIDGDDEFIPLPA